MGNSIALEVAYAEPDRQILVAINLAAGSSVQQALDEAALNPQFHGIDLAEISVGIFGRSCERDQCLADGDRVELYRSLVVDAKTARQRRAAKQKAAYKG
jgi:putative ubiquitin-RnfH superfamily antitoxin RatB of RatAB toxin-antitoxin module